MHAKQQQQKTINNLFLTQIIPRVRYERESTKTHEQTHNCDLYLHIE